MRIVQLANFYTPTSGGLRTSLEQIGRGYLVRGHERILIVPAEQDADERTAAGRRIAIESPSMPGPGGYRILTARRRVLARLDELRPDILEVSDKLSISWLARWARARRVPVMLFSHERLDAILRSRVPRWLPLPALADLVNGRLSRMVEAVVVASRFSAEEFRRVGARNIVQIPLGVDLDTFRPLSTVEQRIHPHAVDLITVGRLSAEKSPELALDCLRTLRASGVDAHLTIVGDGPLRTRMQRQAAGMPVRFTGHVSDTQTIATLVARADVAISPSSAESFGLATLEALACGTPVVVPSAGAAPELIRPDGSGVVCVGTGEGLAFGVRELLSMPELARRAAARSMAECFPWSATVASLLDRYAEARELAARGDGRPGGANPRLRRSGSRGAGRLDSTFGRLRSGGVRTSNTLGLPVVEDAESGLPRQRGFGLGKRRSDDSNSGGWQSAGWGARGRRRAGAPGPDSIRTGATSSGVVDKHVVDDHAAGDDPVRNGVAGRAVGGSGADGAEPGGLPVQGKNGPRRARPGGLKLLSSRRGRGPAGQR